MVSLVGYVCLRRAEVDDTSQNESCTAPYESMWRTIILAIGTLFDGADSP